MYTATRGHLLMHQTCSFEFSKSFYTSTLLHKKLRILKDIAAGPHHSAGPCPNCMESVWASSTVRNLMAYSDRT